ncbi:MAG TPA: thiamine pyrophosphate-dependent enzyme, partial [Candidatus Dormibacteraeota bacterium]|nr:thiamine pyrophosphate-dependent enzyme [Candidatus Dormibacteraeota bacterium]
MDRTEEGDLRLLNRDGELSPGAQAPLDLEASLSALRWMMVSRAYDHRMIALQRQGKTGTFSPVHGQEASVLGPAFALDPHRDWLVPSYREFVGMFHHGYPMASLTATLMGKPAAGRIPDGVRVLPIQVALATQLSHATGLAWGLKLQQRDGVVLVYFGEGASSEGDFHEACNWAGVVKAPVIFWLQDNQWAISTPRRLQSAATNLAVRAQGYGFEGVTVDGNDLFACYQAATIAVAKARAGAGPTLIEAVTYRMGFHNTTDDPNQYRDPEEERLAGEGDPIA